MGSKRAKALIALGLLLVLAGLGWRWRQVDRERAALTAQWTTVLDDGFDQGAASHAQAWDDLLQPAEDGGLYVSSWLHATKAGRPRGPFRLKASFQAGTGPAARWLELASASPVEYYDEDSHGTTLPRSRYAGCFGRVDLGEGHATLTVGQMGLDGKGRRVVARRVEMDTHAALPPLELSLVEDRLLLHFGGTELSTLADQIPSRLSADMRFGLRGERSKALHFSAQILSPSAEDVGLREVETYLALGRHDLIVPRLAEMAALSPTPRLQMRLARAYEQILLPDKAAEIWPSLTDTAKAGFYAGYAQLELLRARAQKGGDAMALDADLARLTSSLSGHPAVPQVQLLRARLLAQAGTGLATARGVAVEALRGSDPEASAEALALLSEGPLALAPAELLGLLDEQAAARPSAFLAELLAAKRAELSLQLGDVKGLAANARASRVLSYATRKKVYNLLASALDQSEAGKRLKVGDSAALRQLLGEAADDPSWVLDYLFVRAVPQTRVKAKLEQQSTSADRALLARLHAFTRLPPGKKIPEAPYYLSSTAQAAVYGQLAQGKLSEDSAQGLCFDFVSGDYWGCGLSIPGALSDLRGARSLSAKVLVPKGVEYYFSLSESGIGAPEAFSFQGKDGADGEQYLLDPRVGTGQWEDLQAPLSQATLSLTWGNAEGNRQLDLQAIQKIDLAIPGGQGRGRVCIKAIRFQ